MLPFQAVKRGPFGKKLLVFDLDGTLIDSAPDIAHGINTVLRRHGLPEREYKYVVWAMGHGAWHLLKLCLPDGECPLSVDDFYAEFLEYYTAHASERTVLYPGVKEFLETAECAKALLTNKAEAPTRVILRNLGVERFFDAVVGGDTLPVRKPDPMGLRMLAELGGVDLSDVLMVGDATPDVECAKNAGVDCVLIEDDGYGKREELALFDVRWRVAHFSDIAALARKSAEEGK